MAAPPTSVPRDRTALLHTLVAIALGLASGIFVFAVVAGLTGSIATAAPITTLCAGLVGWAVRTRLRIPLDASACSRGLAILSVVTTIMAIVLVGRITVFMVNSERAECSFIPS